MSDTVNDKVQVGIEVAGIKVPAVTFDPTKNDVVEENLDRAIDLGDLGDAVPGNGKLDLRASFKVRGIRVPVNIQIDVVPGA